MDERRMADPVDRVAWTCFLWGYGAGVGSIVVGALVGCWISWWLP
jgi:hypothetical protein